MNRAERVRVYQSGLRNLNHARWVTIDFAEDRRACRAVCSCLHSLGVLRGLRTREMEHWPRVRLRETFDALIQQQGLDPVDAERVWVEFQQSSPMNSAAAESFADDLEWHWMMLPERRGASQSGRLLPPPVYFGFPDTGYRVSLEDARSSSGRRRGRRNSGLAAIDGDPVILALGAAVGAVFESDLGVEFGPKRAVHGQQVLPPCDIFCPGCGRLNRLSVPDLCEETLPNGLVRTF